jgi:hypothetical protein
VPPLFLRVFLPDFYTADLTTDGLGQFIDELDNAGILIGSRLFLDVLL